jgi:hypothetical protein
MSLSLLALTPLYAGLAQPPTQRKNPVRLRPGHLVRAKTSASSRRQEEALQGGQDLLDLTDPVMANAPFRFIMFALCVSFVFIIRLLYHSIHPLDSRFFQGLFSVLGGILIVFELI